MLSHEYQTAQEIGMSELELDNLVARKQADKRTVDLIDRKVRTGTIYMYKIGRGASERIQADIQKVGNRLS